MDELMIDARLPAPAKGRGANGRNRKAVTAFTLKAGGAASLAPCPRVVGFKPKQPLPRDRVGLFSLRLLSQWRNLLPNGIELVLEAGMTDGPKRHEATAERKTLIPAGSEQIFSILVDPPGEKVRREWFPGWTVEIDRRLWISPTDGSRCRRSKFWLIRSMKPRQDVSAPLPSLARSAESRSCSANT
jgi:hypothetical protein